MVKENAMRVRYNSGRRIFAIRDACVDKMDRTTGAFAACIFISINLALKGSTEKNA